MSSLIYTEVQNFLDPQNLRNEGTAENYFSQQFEKLLNEQGINKEAISLEQLREMVANLLQDVLVELKEELKK